ncbi:hypothetical protein [Cytobacillus sp. IB215665]|uniref:hypothetical protein n=1 Tax=Cytobacillus sp. IB215665 TaxID=3097357 RepID=UPI002A124E1D|nr:hypothetical protein [Cytobacillus sp. IB215665]MDX8367665.1 hypothetical protein [Cytobacillus sp. IB215665]
MELTQGKSNSIIPEFQTIFSEVGVNASIIELLSAHTKEEQKEIFETFKPIFEDEMTFVLTVYQLQKQEKMKILN